MVVSVALPFWILAADTMSRAAEQVSTAILDSGCRYNV